MPETHPVAPGDTITLLVASIVPGRAPFQPSDVRERGHQLMVTAHQLEQMPNLLLAGDPDAQLKKWGEQRFALGVLDLPNWIHGDPEWARQREEARQAAWQEPNPGRRATALKAVQDVYGAAPSTAVYTDAPAVSYWADRAAAQQAEAEERRKQGQHFVNRSRDADPAWEAERSAALKLAESTPDPQKRAIAIEKVRRAYQRSHG